MAPDSTRSNMRLCSFKISWMNPPRSYLSANAGSCMWDAQSSGVGVKGGRGGGDGSVSKGGLKSGVGASLAKRDTSTSTSILVSIAWLRYSSIGGKSMNTGQLLCSVEYGKVSGRDGGVTGSDGFYKGSIVRETQ